LQCNRWMQAKRLAFRAARMAALCLDRCDQML
jgi:hypothetical protein